MSTPPDVSRERFLSIAERSLLLDPLSLEKIAARMPSGSSRELADALVRDGDLTHFQAEKLLRGRWQGLALGPFRILAPLGRGGMGTVYLARDTRLAEELGDEVLVAMKVLPPKVIRDEPRMLARFEREVGLGLRVNHPNVVKTFGGGESGGVHYLVMEYVRGKTVGFLLSHNGRFSVGEAARLFADVAAGLAAMHAVGLVHRDVKPGNVLVTPDGHAKLFDMGFAFAPGEPLPEDPTIVGGAGYIVGTMDYIAPEQARNAVAATPRSDLYSLGCSLYCVLAGTPPFAGGTAHDKIRRQRTLEPISLQKVNPDVPPNFVRIVEQLMAKRPEDRPPTAIAARELLLPFAAEAHDVHTVSVRDAVDAVDSPDEHPELWDEEEAAELLSLDGTEHANRGRNTMSAVWVVGLFLILAAAFSLLRRL
jgi:serine/threonine protein kinase